MEFMIIKVGITKNKNTIENTTLNIVFDITGTPGPCMEEPSTERLLLLNIANKDIDIFMKSY